MSVAKNYYEVLEIPVSSSQEEIQKGYLRAKNAYSQDSLALYSLIDQDECKEILEMVEEAYEILSNPNKRMAYDKARGLNRDDDRGNQRYDMSINQAQDSTSQISVTKIMARERFSLHYEVDSEFEKEIEQTGDWTGEWLRKIREYKGIGIPRLSDMTKVSKTYLTAIEEERFESLPPTAYVRGFVYQYAKCLKLNPDLVCSSYLYRVKKAKGE